MLYNKQDALGFFQKEASMRTLLHFRTHDGGYFHAHPLHGTFSLITTLVLAMLVVLLLVMTAR